MFYRYITNILVSQVTGIPFDTMDIGIDEYGYIVFRYKEKSLYSNTKQLIGCATIGRAILEEYLLFNNKIYFIISRGKNKI